MLRTQVDTLYNKILKHNIYLSLYKLELKKFNITLQYYFSQSGMNKNHACDFHENFEN